MEKSIYMQILDLQIEISDLEKQFRQTDEEWREAEVKARELEQKSEALYIQKRELGHDMELLTRQLAALQEAEKYERASA